MNSVSLANNNSEDNIYSDNDEIYGRLQRNFSEIFDAISIKTATNGTIRSKRDSRMYQLNDDSDIYEDLRTSFEFTDDFDSYSVKTATYGIVKDIRKRIHTDQSKSSEHAEPIYETIEMETINDIQREMQEEEEDSGSEAFQSDSYKSDANTFTSPSGSSSEDDQIEEEEEVPSNSIRMTSLKRPKFQLGPRSIHSSEYDASDNDSIECL